MDISDWIAYLETIVILKMLGLLDDLTDDASPASVGDAIPGQIYAGH